MAVGIAFFVIAGVVSAYVYMGRNLIRYSNQQDSETQIRRAMQMLASDVHAATDVTSFSASQFTLSLPYVHSDNSVTYYSVSYTYDATAKTLTRTVSGTPPPEVTSSPLTLLSSVSPSGSSLFEYRDRLDQTATTTFGVKKIIIASFALTTGSASADTQLIRTGASPRLVLRSKHLVLRQNGQSY
jgi:hypothetical protein